MLKRVIKPANIDPMFANVSKKLLQNLFEFSFSSIKEESSELIHHANRAIRTINSDGRLFSLSALSWTKLSL